MSITKVLNVTRHQKKQLGIATDLTEIAIMMVVVASTKQSAVVEIQC